MTLTLATDTRGATERVEIFDRMTLLGRRWYFRIVDAGNHETLAPSEAYNSAAARDKTANRFARALGCPIVEGRRK